MEFAEYNVLFKKIHTVIEKKINTSLQEENLTLAQWNYLYYIYSKGGENIHMKDIEHFFEVSQPTVAGILRRMREKGLIYLEKSDYSSNSKAVSLTNEGRELYKRGLKQKEYIDELMLKPLNEDERSAFADILQKIYEGIKNV
ncbi:MAG: MarR family winged helix-turn-helix transcriptional regulator [Candidatus Ornithomonoglobus sp.]